ncbi:serine/threonine protein kinase [Corynebacterium sp. CCUG 18816]|uniref:serine/threonine protein kinase n=1 Tax=Corynebacterium pseudogenitalium TaxID=38303 RepID=UPI00210E7EB2|nr:serine/threonine protein kinase [Corynebacterium pseudogenitalium]MCQ4617289.1 serine/threonine protein kinase [Corynebacterium pseudogenitalium]
MSTNDPGTEAVAFDPFADDDDDDDLFEYDDSMSALLEDLEALRQEKRQEDTSQRSRRRALDRFRELRGTQRETRTVADGMVELPWVHPINPTDALRDPSTFEGVPAPALKPGDLVAEQYEVLGTIAHGGMGWIYLATDHFVSGRNVVLKGLHSARNKDEEAAAVAEREFLADITHPGIVKIFNFIDDPRVPGGFIVMEYVGGPSISRCDVDIAIAYILEVLPALDYLHSRGVVYNDLKPDNIIVTEDQVKLIDLGAVSGIGSYGFIYGTKGYQAPEVATDGPSIQSDIYTIGRTLAALIIDLPHDADIPTPTTEPLFRRYISLYRLIARCCAPNRDDRFDSVTQLEAQLLGVLREVLAIRDGRTFPAQHSLFSPQRRTFGTKHVVFHTDQLIDGITRTVTITPQEVNIALPVPLVDATDPGAATLQSTTYSEPSETLAALRQALAEDRHPDSIEIPFAVARTLLDLGFTTQARTWLDSLDEALRKNWRYHWYTGITNLLTSKYTDAQVAFSRVLQILPGESASKLALAAVAELLLQSADLHDTALLEPRVARGAAGMNRHLDELPNTVFEHLHETGSLDPDWSMVTTNPAMLRFHAIRLYALVWSTNPTTVSSAFGLARQLMHENQPELAAAALDRVPVASRHNRLAQLTSILSLVTDPTEPRIREAALRLQRIPNTEPRYLQIKVFILRAALTYTLDGHHPDPSPILDTKFTAHELQNELARTLRALARVAPYLQHRFDLVDMANKIRPVTWF